MKKLQTELKSLQHSSYIIDLSKGTILTNKLKMCVYLRSKYEVSNIILASLRQSGNFTPQKTNP